MESRAIDPSKRDPNVLDAVEVGNRLGIHSTTVRRLALEGRLPCLRLGREFRFWWPAVIERLGQNDPALTGEGGSETSGEEEADAPLAAENAAPARQRRLPEPAKSEPLVPPKRRGTPRLPKGERPPAQ